MITRNSQPITELMQAARAEFDQWRSAPIVLRAVAQLQAELDADALAQKQAA